MPSTTEGSATYHASWAVVEFTPAHGGSLDAALVGLATVEYSNTTWMTMESDLVGYSEVPLPSQSGNRQLAVGPTAVTWSGVGSLGLRGDLEIIIPDGIGQLRLVPNGGLYADDSGKGLDDAVSAWAAQADAAQVYVELDDVRDVTVRTADLQALELLGATVSCTLAVCPLGGENSAYPAGPGTLQRLGFERLTGITGEATLQASPLRIRFGGPVMSMAIDGAMRMPRAEVQGLCECPLDGDQTLSLSGEFAFAELAARGDDRIGGQVSGEGVRAFSDEQAITIPALAATSAAAAAGVAVVVIVVKLLAGLFTRLSKEEALEHPKRQRIFAYIQEHPGANFREVARNTAIAAGTVRHHLTVLERAGHVVEHPHQGTVRLFENHGKFDHNWSDLVLLREAPLAEVHGWIQQNPSSPQKAILEAFEARGWSRSTTQHRLSRLVEGGVVVIRLQGRLKIYSVLDRQAPRPPAVLFQGARQAWAS